jgi:hypothetical protein
MGSDTLAAVDRDVLSRFATCCRALGLSVHDRRRPADLAAARSGFVDLTRIAYEHCDAWTGLAAAGDVSPRVVESVWRTVATAGALQRQLELAPGELGFTYGTGLYLQFRASSPDDYQLAYAATLSDSGDHAAADRLVGPLIERRPSWPQARWVRVAMYYRTERWSDVVRLLTPVVNDAALDETYAHAARVALGTALARLGMFAPALSYLEEPAGPVRIAAVDGALGKALSLRAQGEDLEAADVLADLYAANPEHEHVQLALSDSSYAIVPTTAARIEARRQPRRARATRSPVVAAAGDGSPRGARRRRRADPVATRARRGRAGHGRVHHATHADPDRDERSRRRGAARTRCAARADGERHAGTGAGLRARATVTVALAVTVRPARDAAGAATDPAITEQRQPRTAARVSQPARARRR